MAYNQYMVKIPTSAAHGEEEVNCVNTMESEKTFIPLKDCHRLSRPMKQIRV